MATLVKFVKEGESVVAVFPQLKFNKKLYGNDCLLSYSHIGQHSPTGKEWANQQNTATESEYNDLKQELESIGYTLKICK